MAIYYCKISKLRCHTWKLYISYHFRIYSNFCHSCLASIFFNYCNTEFWTVIIQEFVILHQVSSVQCLYRPCHGALWSIFISFTQKTIESFYKWTLLRSVNFEMSFWCLQIDQKNNEIFVRISALTSKKMSNQKCSVRERESK